MVMIPMHPKCVISAVEFERAITNASKHAALSEHDLSSDYLVRRYLKDAEHALDRVEYYCDVDLSDVEEQLSRVSSEDDINWVEWSFFERVRKGL